jgi:3-phosphoshikimate 1-carboxyvinyltransferase
MGAGTEEGGAGAGALEAVEMRPLERPLRDARWEVPGSKSITNRALILAALRNGTTELKGVLHSDDTEHMRNALVALGIEIEETGPTSLKVRGGVHRLRAPGKDIFIGNSGTTVRFLTVFCCLVPGDVTLVGDKHMAKRPIGFLGDALRQMGVLVECPTGCPPLTIRGSASNGLPGGKVSMPGYKSSQYFSALMLTGGHAQQDLPIQVEGELVSFPYVQMTMDMVKLFGGCVEHDAQANSFLVKKIAAPAVGAPAAPDFVYVIEPDASSASYPFALAAANHCAVTVPNLCDTSMQGDFLFTNVLKMMGCEVSVNKDGSTTVRGTKPGTKLKGVDVDMHHISDTVMTLAAIAPLCDGPTTIRNVANIRIKETDRLLATVDELKRLGQIVEHGDDWLKITPVAPVTPAHVQCYADHRMAMAFAILGKAVSGVTITDKGCTAKTYPEFFEDLDKVCATYAPKLRPHGDDDAPAPKKHKAN